MISKAKFETLVLKAIKCIRKGTLDCEDVRNNVGSLNRYLVSLLPDPGIKIKDILDNVELNVNNVNMYKAVNEWFEDMSTDDLENKVKEIMTSPVLSLDELVRKRALRPISQLEDQNHRDIILFMYYERFKALEEGKQYGYEILELEIDEIIDDMKKRNIDLTVTDAIAFAFAHYGAVLGLVLSVDLLTMMKVKPFVEEVENDKENSITE